MTILPSGFAETAVLAQWVSQLGGIGGAIAAQTQGVAETSARFSRATVTPAPFWRIPGVLARRRAPDYLEAITGQPITRTGMMAFLGIDESRLIGRNLDLWSALTFVEKAPTDREYAIERDVGEGFRLISGYDGGVACLGETVLHTHRNRIALPSEQDLVKYEMMAVETPLRWSLIYSRPRKGPQVCFIERTGPCLFQIRFWRDRVDGPGGERRSETRCFEIQAQLERPLDIVQTISVLRTVERSLDGRELGSWHYDPERYPDVNIQKYWKDVLDRAP
jgi:hypothetical protein